MEYIGDRDQAAPRLAQTKPNPAELRSLFDDFRENQKAFLRSGFVHADLSPYNTLVWGGRLWIIDVPQAVPFLDNLSATEFLHRDIVNMVTWFNRKGMTIDPEDVFVEMLDVMFQYQMEDLFTAK